MSATWIELDLALLKRNLAAVRQALPRGAHLVFGVEGNAYGHGLTEVARCGWSCGVKTFQAGGVEEAVSIRRQLPDARIIVAGIVDPDDVEAILEHRLTVVVVSEAHARALCRRTASRMAAVEVHAEIDTGMGLLGFDWQRGAETLGRLSRTPGLRIVGLCSTFSDSQAADGAFAGIQAARFRRVVEACRGAGLRLPLCCMADAAAMLANPDWVMDGARPGLLPYGYPPRAPNRPAIACAPFLQWKARLAEVREVAPGFAVGAGGAHLVTARTRVGTVAAGYGDGVDRRIGGRGCVLVGGRPCPVVGQVELGALAVDLGADGPQRAGDEVVLLGSQGGATLGADEIADRCGTVAAAVLTHIRAETRVALRGHPGW